MGLRADIYKSGGRSFANGGFSDSFDRVTVVNIDGPFDPSEDAPPVLLKHGAFPGIAVAVPAIETPTGYVEAGYGDFADHEAEGGVGPMMGGCYIATLDSRFVEAVEQITRARFYGGVALHDRFESVSLHRMMSI